MFETKDPGHNAQVFSKKKVFRNYLRGLWRAPKHRKKWSLPWTIFNKSKSSAVLGPRTGHFRGFVGFEAKDFKKCS